MGVILMGSKYEPSPYKEYDLDARQALDDRDENLNDENQHKKKKFKNKYLKGFDKF